MASRFSDRILKVMSVSGYHAGDEILVEVDIGTTPSLPALPRLRASFYVWGRYVDGSVG